MQVTTLNELVITYVFIEVNEDGTSYPTTQIWRMDLAARKYDNIEKIIAAFAQHPAVVHVERLAAAPR